MFRIIFIIAPTTFNNLSYAQPNPHLSFPFIPPGWISGI
jgi:hypothetical protein